MLGDKKRPITASTLGRQDTGTRDDEMNALLGSSCHDKGNTHSFSESYSIL